MSNAHPNITLRKSKDRGQTSIDWLESYHTFSFGDYYDPKHMQFRTLRVINDDIVSPGQGFGMHPHRDMEIVTHVISGELKHQDSMGNVGVIKKGEVQKMTAGKGVRHSEFNASSKEPVHLLQIWILPEKTGLEPSYGQITLPSGKNFGLKLFASHDAGKDMILIHQDVKIYQGLFKAGDSNNYKIAQGRGVWIQMIQGKLSCEDNVLSPGDGVSIDNAVSIELKAKEDTEFLLFDLK